jgi:protocatechuate 3,4-dioxygenase, alpha subunit
VDGEVLSPSQTPGPMYGFALMFEGCDRTVADDAPGAVAIEGRLLDGDGEPVAYPDALIEVWRGEQWTRSRTDEDGRYRVVLAKPDAAELAGVGIEAPYLNVDVFARGLLRAAATRLYFPDEEQANAADPVLQLVPPDRRHTLVARAEGRTLRFDIRLQGDDETVFFES